MNTKLQTLQALIAELNNSYQANLKELNHLKARPVVDAKKMEDLQANFERLTSNFTDLQKKYDSLDHKTNNIEKGYRHKCAEVVGLNERNHQLAIDKREVLLKNEVSLKQVQRIMDQLSALDINGPKF